MSSGSEGIPGVPEFEQNFNRFSRLCKVYGVPNTHTHTHKPQNMRLLGLCDSRDAAVEGVHRFHKADPNWAKIFNGNIA